jgi:hypothetical protein
MTTAVNMAAPSALTALPENVKALVFDASKVDGGSTYGVSEKDKADIAVWLEKITQGDIVKPQSFQASMHIHLGPFLNANVLLLSGS